MILALPCNRGLRKKLKKLLVFIGWSSIICDRQVKISFNLS